MKADPIYLAETTLWLADRLMPEAMAMHGEGERLMNDKSFMDDVWQVIGVSKEELAKIERHDAVRRVEGRSLSLADLRRERLYIRALDSIGRVLAAAQRGPAALVTDRRTRLERIASGA